MDIACGSGCVLCGVPSELAGCMELVAGTGTTCAATAKRSTNDTVRFLKKQRHPYENLSMLYMLIQGAI